MRQMAYMAPRHDICHIVTMTTVTIEYRSNSVSESVKGWNQGIHAMARKTKHLNNYLYIFGRLNISVILFTVHSM
jgi:recombinational DNA repair protein RecT